jgi:hypothetical protein
MKTIQQQVKQVYESVFGRTPLKQRLDDIFNEALELKRFSDMKNLREETGDVLSSLIQLVNEYQVKPYRKPVSARIRACNTYSAGEILRYVTTDIVICIIVIGLPKPSGVDDFLFQFFSNLRTQLCIHILGFIFEIVYPECFYFSRQRNIFS